MSDVADWKGLLNIHEVEVLYADNIARFGGISGPPKAGCVEGSVGNAWSASLYISSGADARIVFAAYVLYYLVRAHCFLDGNKRIGWICCFFVLQKLGYTFAATQDEVVEFGLAIASGRIADGSEAVEWVLHYLIPTPD